MSRSRASVIDGSFVKGVLHDPIDREYGASQPQKVQRAVIAYYPALPTRTKNNG